MYHHKTGIRLRKVRQSDLAELLRLKAESWWGTHKTVIANHDDQNRWLESLPGNCLCMIAEGAMNNDGMVPVGQYHETTPITPIGVAMFTDIDWIDRSLRLSGSVFDRWRKPEVTKAGFAAGLDFGFEMLNMRRIEAEVLEYHIPAQKLEIDYLGFTVEGRRREAVYKCGYYYDSLVLGMLRSEWAADPRVLAMGGSCNLTFDRDKMRRMGDKSNRKTAEVERALSLLLEA